MARCDVCHKQESSSIKLIEDHSRYLLCLDCAANMILKKTERVEKVSPTKFSDLIGYTTKDMFNKLSINVIGQEQAKKTLSIAVINHLKRLSSSTKIDKSNVLLIGPTGSGKTFITKELAKHTSIPFGMADATTLTASGWTGDDPESVLLDLYHNCGGNKSQVENGIVFIDEIDKLANENVKGGRESSNGAQRGLLKILEGNVVALPLKRDRNSGEGRIEYIDTTNILFILGGAFNGLNDIIKERNTKSTIGFSSELTTSNSESQIQTVTTEDLEKYGFLAEFLGRVPIRTHLTELSRSELREVLVRGPESITSQYIELFKMDDINLIFNSTGLDRIVELAHELKVGARALRTVVDKVLFDFQFEYDSSELVITEALVNEKTNTSSKSETGNKGSCNVNA